MSENSEPSENPSGTEKKLGGITGKGFMPGQSGNPSGRPSRRRMAERYEALMDEPLREELRVALKLKNGATWGDAIVLGQARAAIKGKTEAAREIVDRVDGKARQQVEVSGPEGGPIDLAERIARVRRRLDEYHRTRREAADGRKTGT